MIPRTRPNIDVDKASVFFKRQKTIVDFGKNIFFFNSGQSCLYAFLQMFGSGKCVGVQVFTCPTVLTVIRKAGHKPVFFDINEDYFTTTKDIIEDKIHDLDILVLTHVFGIPNPDYLLIKQMCQDNKVVVIDDLCQTFRAKVKSCVIEDMSDNYFYSFYNDKPISCASGGMLKVADQYVDGVRKYAERLPVESSFVGKGNIRRLVNVYRLLASDVYKRDFRNGNVIENFLLSYYPLSINERFLYKILTSFVNGIAYRIFPQYDYSSVYKRMSDVQILYVHEMFKSFKNRNDLLKEYFNKYKYKLPQYIRNVDIECSFSQRIIVRADQVNISTNDAEIALYNWPSLLDDIGKYPNASRIVNNYVNIPLDRELWK